MLQILLRKPRHNHRTDIFIDIPQPAVLSGADLRTTPIVERELFEQRRRPLPISCQVVTRQTCTQNVVHKPRVLPADVDQVGQTLREFGVIQHENARNQHRKNPAPQPAVIRDLRNRLQCRKVADLALEHLVTQRGTCLLGKKLLMLLNDLHPFLHTLLLVPDAFETELNVFTQ